MIVDTNVLIRSLGAAGGTQTTAVRGRVRAARETETPLVVLSATVLEAAYVLASEGAGFGWTRNAVSDAVEAIVDEPAFEVEHASALLTAAGSHRSRSIDLHDCFLSALATERNTRVLSFDEDIRKLGHRERP